MCFLLICMAWGKLDISDFQIDVVCYESEGGSQCEDVKAAAENPDSPAGKFHIKSFSTVTPRSLSTCFDSIGSYPVLVYVTGETTGDGQDFFDFGKMKTNHVIQFLSIGGGVNAVSQLESSLSKLEMLAQLTKSGTVLGEDKLQKLVKDTSLQEPGPPTIHIKDTSAETAVSKVDCVFFTGLNVHLMTDVKVQAAIAPSSFASSTTSLKASYFLCDPFSLDSVIRFVKSTSVAVYLGGEDQDSPMLSHIRFTSDGWALRYAGSDSWVHTIHSTVIQKGGQFSVLQIAGPDRKLDVSFELDSPTTLAGQTIAGGLNLSVQREADVALSLGLGTAGTEEKPGSPSMTVTFTGDWNQVTNLADAKFVFEGDVKVNDAGKPANVQVEYGKISDRPLGPGVTSAPKGPVEDPVNIGLIVGCTVAAVVVVAAIIVGVVLFLRFKKKKDQSSESSDKKEQPAE